jgi:hypothetical protein
MDPVAQLLTSYASELGILGTFSAEQLELLAWVWCSWGHLKLVRTMPPAAFDAVALYTREQGRLDFDGALVKLQDVCAHRFIEHLNRTGCNSDRIPTYVAAPQADIAALYTKLTQPTALSHLSDHTVIAL